MPIAILLVGVLLVVVGINNKLGDLGGLIKEDFAPSHGETAFHVWIVAIFVLGSLGYIRSFKPVANGLLVLVVIVLFLRNADPHKSGGGFFATFNRAIQGS